MVCREGWSATTTCVSEGPTVFVFTARLDLPGAAR
jgi:hypothetical protein